MKVQEFRVKKVITTKGELVSINEWDSFVLYYHLHEQGMVECSDDEQFVLDPADAVIFNLLPHSEAEKLSEFYHQQLI